MSNMHSRGASSNSAVSVMYQQYSNLNKGKDISPVRPSNESRYNPATIDQSKYSTVFNRQEENNGIAAHDQNDYHQ